MADVGLFVRLVKGSVNDGVAGDLLRGETVEDLNLTGDTLIDGAESALTRCASVELDAGALTDLATTRIELLGNQGPNTWVIGERLAVIKTGGPATPAEVDDTNLWVATAPVAGGLVEAEAGAPNYYVIGDGALYRPAGGFLANAQGWLRPGDWAVHTTATAVGGGLALGGFTGGAQTVNMWKDTPLTVLGYAEPKTGPPAETAAERWASATNGLGDISLRLVLEYSLYTPPTT